MRIFIAAEPVALRRGHDRLAALVRALGRQNLYAGHLFVFVGQRTDRVKLLFSDRGGFVADYKRFEPDGLCMPRVPHLQDRGKRHAVGRLRLRHTTLSAKNLPPRDGGMSLRRKHRYRSLSREGF